MIGSQERGYPMPCPNCRKMMDARQRFCPHCGVDTDAKLRPWRFALPLVLVAILALAGLLRRAENLRWDYVAYSLLAGGALGAALVWRQKRRR